MIRYTHSLNSVDLTSQDRSVFFDDTSRLLVVVPSLLSNKERVVCTVNNGQNYVTRSSERSVEHLTPLHEGNVHEIASTSAIILPVLHPNLPVILAPGTELSLIRPSAIEEGVKTGAANGTLGALIGLIGGFLLGGPLGALWGSTLLGVGTAATTGTAQSIAQANSNQFREFAIDANLTLLDLRASGVNPVTAKGMRDLLTRVKSNQERQLFKQIVDALDQHLGNAETSRLLADAGIVRVGSDFFLV